MTTTEQATMIGRRMRYELKGAPPVVGVVEQVKKATLVDRETGEWIPAFRFALRTLRGRIVWTCAMAASRPEAPGA